MGYYIKYLGGLFTMTRNKIFSALLRLTGVAAMFSAALVANRVCTFLVHQEEEPEAVRKLRKF